MQKFAIYDMDKTITRAATFGPFLAYAVPRYALWRTLFAPLLLLTGLAYGLKLIDRAQLKALNLRILLGSVIHGERLGSIARGFAERTLSRNILNGALDQIARDKAEGHSIAIASASYAFYVREIAALLGITHVIATETAHHPQGICPIIAGENCYGAAKLAMVTAWHENQGLPRSQMQIRFYSDHVSDAPCLAWADEAFAICPHAPLRALAREKNWHIIDW